MKYTSLFLLFLLAFACNQTDHTSQTPSQSVEGEDQDPRASDTEDIPMSDSTVAELIRAASPQAQELQKIDFSTCEQKVSVSGLKFDMSAIGKYHNQVENFVEYCLYEFNREDLSTYIIFNNEIESHYSPYFKLLKVKGDDTLSMTTIAQIYGNEQYDYVLSSKGVGDGQFELTKLSTYRYIQGVEKVDSTSTEITLVELW